MSIITQSGFEELLIDEDEDNSSDLAMLMTLKAKGIDPDIQWDSSSESELLKQQLINSSTPQSKTPSMTLHTFTIPVATIISIDIAGFTAICSTMSAQSVGEWMAEFYQSVDDAASLHNVVKVETRGDCCICIAGVLINNDQTVKAIDGSNHFKQMLEFATELHCIVSQNDTQVRMGIATGEVMIIIEEKICGLISLQGETISHAIEMEGLATTGVARIYANPPALYDLKNRRFII